MRRYQILIYHKVSPEHHPFFEATHPTLFEEQLSFLSRYYNVLDLQEIIDLGRRGALPARAVAITFDDGYSDNYEFAFPLLRKYRVPATMFLATGAIDNRSVLWHDRVFDSLRFATVRNADLSQWDNLKLSLKTVGEMQQTLSRTIRYAKQLPEEARIRFVEEVERVLSPDLIRNQRVPMLEWEQVKEMSKAGIRFGSHTVSHPILSRVGMAQLRRELVESKRELEEVLGTPICSFAYPNGKSSDYNEEVKIALRESGYKYAVTTQSGFNTTCQDLLDLKRGQPWQQDLALFRLNFFLQRHGLAVG